MIHFFFVGIIIRPSVRQILRPKGGEVLQQFFFAHAHLHIFDDGPNRNPSADDARASTTNARCFFYSRKIFSNSSGGSLHQLGYLALRHVGQDRGGSFQCCHGCVFSCKVNGEQGLSKCSLHHQLPHFRLPISEVNFYKIQARTRQSEGWGHPSRGGIFKQNTPSAVQYFNA